MRFGSCYYLLPRFLERMNYLRDVPCIELGFPPTVSAFDEVLGSLPQIAGAILRQGTQVVSIHFPHLPITHPGFMERAQIAAEFAMNVDAKTITVHPHKCTSSRWYSRKDARAPPQAE